jgi:hypothetical protein
MYPTVSWNESSPAGSDLMSTVDNRVREMKIQIREVVGVDHDFPSSGQATDNGQHLRVTLQEQADLGSGAVGTTILGSQTINGKGELVYTDEDDNDVQMTKDGKIHAPSLGGVYPAADVASVASIMNYVYPVGSVYTNYSVSTNPGTLLGVGTWVAIAGRVVVGLDGTQTEFDTAGETGGAKTHTLTTDEIPAHTHTYYKGGLTGDVAGPGFNYLQTSLQNTGSTGGGSAHNNLQPYVVCYVWRRTA